MDDGVGGRGSLFTIHHDVINTIDNAHNNLRTIRGPRAEFGPAGGRGHSRHRGLVVVVVVVAAAVLVIVRVSVPVADGNGLGRHVGGGP